MKRRVWILISGLCVFSLLSPVEGKAGEFIAFGPQVFEKQKGGPSQTVRTITLPDPTLPYLIRVFNGGQKKEFRAVSEGSVSLNGTLIFGPSGWNQATVFEKPVQIEKTNSLRVEIRSPPGSGFELVIVGIDNRPPSIEITQPGPDSLTGKRSPQVVVFFEDSGTGIDPSTFMARLNGAEVARGFTLTPRSATFVPPPLPEGKNHLAVSVKDRAGNDASASSEFVVDTTPPVISVTSPGPGSLTNTPSLSVSGSVTDVHSGISSVLINGRPASLKGALFTGTVSLSEGENEVTIRATDAMGNSSSTRFAATLDTIPPVVLFSSPPEDGLVTRTPRMKVAGRVSDAHPLSSVTVNGTGVTLEGQGFAFDLPLKEGSNPITASAQDGAGNSSSATVGVLRDTTPPHMTITSPPDRALFSSTTVEVSGTIDDPDAMVSINNTPASVNNGIFTGRVPLQEGTNTVSVTASDPLKNSVTVTLSVVRDTTPPRIEITSPRQGSSLTTPSLVVSGRVTDGGGDGVTVTINGAAVPVINGRFASEKIPLSPGHHNIAVVATDRAGNSATTRIPISLSFTVGPVTPPPLAPPTLGPPPTDGMVNLNGMREPLSQEAISTDGIPAAPMPLEQTSIGPVREVIPEGEKFRIGRDPFLFPPEELPASGEKKGAGQKGYHLSAIIHREGKGLAIINDQIMRKGDTLDGKRIVNILKDKVVLKDPGGEETELMIERFQMKKERKE